MRSFLRLISKMIQLSNDWNKRKLITNNSYLSIPKRNDNLRCSSLLLWLFLRLYSLPVLFDLLIEFFDELRDDLLSSRSVLQHDFVCLILQPISSFPFLHS